VHFFKYRLEISDVQSLRYRKFWLMVGMLILGVTLYFALAPANRTVTVAFLSDKFFHSLAFFILMIWFSGLFRTRYLPYVAISLLIYGGLIELVQSRLPYRTAEVADLVFDFGGIVLGWAVARAGLQNWTVKLENWVTGARV
jgi:VanZ family protein